MAKLSLGLKVTGLAELKKAFDEAAEAIQRALDCAEHVIIGTELVTRSDETPPGGGINLDEV